MFRNEIYFIMVIICHIFIQYLISLKLTVNDDLSAFFVIIHYKNTQLGNEKTSSNMILTFGSTLCKI